MTEEVIDYIRGGKGLKKDSAVLGSQANDNLINMPENNNHQILVPEVSSNNNNNVVVNNNNLLPPSLSQDAENKLKTNVTVNQNNLQPPPTLLLPNLSNNFSLIIYFSRYATVQSCHNSRFR